MRILKPIIHAIAIDIGKGKESVLVFVGRKQMGPVQIFLQV